MDALEYLQELKQNGTIGEVGLCNWDTVHTDEICTQFPGLIVSNQVQVRLHTLIPRPPVLVGLWASMFVPACSWTLGGLVLCDRHSTIGRHGSRLQPARNQTHDLRHTGKYPCSLRATFIDRGVTWVLVRRLLKREMAGPTSTGRIFRRHLDPFSTKGK